MTRLATGQFGQSDPAGKPPSSRREEISPAATSAPTQILLADDHAVVRRGFRLILDQYPKEFEVVGEAGTGEETLQLLVRLEPDVLVLDISMPNLNGIEVAQRVREQYPEVKILILSMHGDAAYVRETLRAGAKGYLLKDSVDTEFLTAVRTVAGNQAYISASVSNTVLADYQKFVGHPLDLLTPREYGVFKLLAEAKTAKEIATELNISVYTVDAHRNRVFKKLGLRSSTDLVRFAIREGIVD